MENMSSEMRDLCVRCSNIFIHRQSLDNLAKGTITAQWRSSSMRESAEKGCQLCNLLYLGHEHSTPLHSLVLRRTIEDSDFASFYSRTNPPNPQPTDFFLDYRFRTGYMPHEVSAHVTTTLRFNRDEEQIGLILCSEIGNSNPASSLGFPQSPNLDVTSQQTYELVRTWLEGCDQQCGEHEEHPSCRTPQARLPTRVLEISPKTGTEPTVRVYHSSRELSTYAALSYCWGGNQPFSTTTRNVSQYSKTGISLQNLPQSIRDAVWVTAKLGLRYLWVDSLCIIQDSDSDKAHEIARMSDVYRMSYITISAASAGTCYEGFLQPRRDCGERVKVPFGCKDGLVGSVLLYRKSKVLVESLDPQEPIDKRAWTLQESFMSPRLLIYSRSQLFWSCQHVRGRDGGVWPWGSEDGAQTGEEHYNRIRYRASYRGGARDRLAVLGSASIDTWKQIIENYSRRRLTEPLDKFLAISSIAAHFSDLLSSQYLAGLFKTEFARQLFWKAKLPSNLTRPGVWRSPSWSFMSVDGDIDFSVTQRLDMEPKAAQITDFKITLEDDNLPFGKLRAGWIKIRGYLGQVYPSRTDHSPSGLGGKINFGPEPAASSALSFGEFQFDTVNLEASVVTTNHGPQEWSAPIWCLTFRSRSFGLMLDELPDGNFHRIVVFGTDSDALRASSKTWQRAEIVIV